MRILTLVYRRGSIVNKAFTTLWPPLVIAETANPYLFIRQWLTATRLKCMRRCPLTLSRIRNKGKRPALSPNFHSTVPMIMFLF